jgi:hypothetical protein
VEQTFQIIASGMREATFFATVCKKSSGSIQEAFLVVARNAFHFYDIALWVQEILNSRLGQTLILAP